MDYVLSHAAPREIIRRMGHSPGDHDLELTGFLEWVMYQTEYKAWFFGHWHSDWGYENLAQARHVPLYHRGVVV